MLCPNCGAENDADARFCTTCGASLAPHDTQTAGPETTASSAAAIAEPDPDASEAPAPDAAETTRPDAENHGPRLEPVGPKEAEAEPEPSPQPVLEPVPETAEPQGPRLVPMGAETAPVEPAPKDSAEPPLPEGGVTLEPLDTTAPSVEPAPKLEPMPAATTQNQQHVPPAPADPAVTGRIPVVEQGPAYVDPSSEPALPALLARCAALTVYAFLALSLIFSVALKGSAAADALAACASSAAALGSFVLLFIGIALALMLAFVIRGLDPKAVVAGRSRRPSPRRSLFSPCALCSWRATPRSPARPAPQPTRAPPCTPYARSTGDGPLATSPCSSPQRPSRRRPLRLSCVPPLPRARA